MHNLKKILKSSLKKTNLLKAIAENYHKICRFEKKLLQTQSIESMEWTSVQEWEQISPPGPLSYMLFFENFIQKEVGLGNVQC